MSGSGRRSQSGKAYTDVYPWRQGCSLGSSKHEIYTLASGNNNIGGVHNNLCRSTLIGTSIDFKHRPFNRQDFRNNSKLTTWLRHLTMLQNRVNK
jgi:hypothetical protein